MAVNIPMASGPSGSFPLPYQGEVFLLTRDKTSFSFWHGGHSAKRLSGRLYVTNVRIVFDIKSSDQRNAHCQTVELPFRGMWNEAFHQPIFGCNNLTINVRYYDNQPFTGDLKVRVDFLQGGVNTFLPIFNTVLHATRVQIQQEQRAQAQVQPVPTQASVPSAETYYPNQNSAFVDPRDPSQIYTMQPAAENVRSDVPSWSVSGGGMRRR